MKEPDHGHRAGAPQAEAARLEAIRELGLLAIEGDPLLDAITDMAARITGCSRSFITIVGAEHAHLVSRVGGTTSELPREHTFCDRTIRGSALLEVPDAQRSEVFRNDPLVKGEPHLRFYAGVPLSLGPHRTVGTLCVLDTEPRQLTDAQRSELEVLARMAVDLLQRRGREQEHLRIKQMLGLLKEVNEEFINRSADRRVLFDRILGMMLSLTESEYGFIGEVLHRDGKPFLKTHAITNIAWNKETRDFYEQNAPKGMEFSNLRTLFGHTLTSGEPVIANEPYTDPRRGGLPPGHPALNHYLGIPIKSSDGKMIGMAGLANKPAGYSVEDIDFLGPFLSTIATLITAIRIDLARAETEAHNELMAERLRQARAVSRMGDSEFTLEGYKLAWSDEMYGIFELPRLRDKELVDALMQRIHPEDMELVTREGRSVLAGKRVDFEYRIVFPDGRIKNILAYRVPVHDAEGRVVGIRGTDHDITDRRRSENMLLRFFDVSGEMLCVLDAEDRMLRVGHALADTVGRPANELLAVHLTELLHEEDHPAMKEGLARLHKGSPRTDLRARLLRADGTSMMVDWSASIDSASNLVYLMGKDVTMKDQLEQALWAGRMEAERTRAKDVFIANVSHEIRTPLNAIVGFSELLGQTLLSDVQRRHLEVIQVASRNLTTIINDILDLAKLDGGKLELERKPISIEETVRQVVSMHTERARSKGIKLLFSMDPELPPRVMGDQTRLTQILMNLVSNAMKFTDKGQVRVDVLEAAQEPGSVRVRFAVSDTGIGIEASKLNMIFERFTQAETYTTRVYGGTGLGLNIVRSLVELHGGILQVESHPGKGSTFWCEITFPIAEGALVEEPGPLQPNLSKRVLQGVRVLLVEDNEHNQILARTYLERNGAEVRVAGNGAIALRGMEEAKPDLVLMDVQMPVMDGIQTTEVLRGEMGVKVPIVACSAHALASERQRCLDAGMNDYITKPYTEAGLVAIILNNLAACAVEPGAPHPAPVEDIGWFDSLASDLGPEVAANMRDALVRSMPRWLALVGDRLQDGDMQQLHVGVHGIAGGLAAMRLVEGQQLARACEQACARQDAADARRLAVDLLRWLNGLDAELPKAG